MGGPLLEAYAMGSAARGDRSASRWMPVVLGILLAVLSGAAVLGSIRQAMIAEHITDLADEVRVYEDAAYASLREMEVIQGAPKEPDGEEPQELPGANADATAAIDRAARAADLDTIRDIAG